MRIDAPKPDFGMDPWILTMLIMAAVVFQAITGIILGILAFIGGAVVWSFFKARQDIRREKQMLEELSRGK